jgi:type I restriction enzyme, S subunit
LNSTSTRLTTAGSKFSRTIESGTLLLTNSGATLGVPKISLIRGCINDGVAAFLRMRPEVSKEFLYYYLTTQTTHLKAWVDTGAQPNLNTQIIGGWPVLLPPGVAQDEIVGHVQRETAVLAKAVDKAAHQISLLNEYRTRLISDVVTGTLDVREAAARLPQEADELESLDDVGLLTEGDAEIEDADPQGVLEEAEA